MISTVQQDWQKTT